MARRIVSAIATVSAACAATAAIWLVSGSFATPAESIVPDPDLQPLVSAGYATQNESGLYTFNHPLIEQRIDQLPPTDEVLIRAYERDTFGQRWADVDRNGCDTRIICSP